MPGRKHTDPEYDARLEELEAVLARGAWSRRTIRQLCERHNVGVAQLYRDRQHILKQASEDASLRDRWKTKADLLLRVRQAQRRTADQDRWTAHCRLLNLESRITGAEEAIQVEVTHKLEQMSPAEQARLIVESYEEARAYLEQDDRQLVAIDADYEVNG